MSDESHARFAALKEATLALSALCAAPGTEEAALREAVRTLQLRRNAMESMWNRLSEGEREPHEEQMDQAEAIALKRIGTLNPYIKTLEDARDRKLPVYSPMSTRSKRKKPSARGREEEEEPRPGPSRRILELCENEGTNETDYESAGEIEIVHSGTIEEGRPVNNGESSATDDDIEFVGVSRSNTDNEVDNARGGDSGRTNNDERESGRSGNGLERPEPRDPLDRDASAGGGPPFRRPGRDRSRSGSGNREANRGVGSRDGSVRNDRNRSTSPRNDHPQDRGSGRNHRPEAQNGRPNLSRSNSREAPAREGRQQPRNRSYSRDREEAWAAREGRNRSRRERDRAVSRSFSRDREEPPRRIHRQEPPNRRNRTRSPSRGRADSRDRAYQRGPNRPYSRERAGQNRRQNRTRSPSRSRRNSRNRMNSGDRDRNRRYRNDQRTPERRPPRNGPSRGGSPRASGRNQGQSYRQYQNSYYQSYRQHSQGNRNREGREQNGRNRNGNQSDYSGYSGQGRDRAQSWGQQHYYPRENRNFVPPQGDARFGELQFPDSWALPAAADFNRYFTSVDVLPLLGKPNAFGNFNGTVDAYPGWQENFYRVVHVQPVPLIHKVNALDQAVSQDVKNKLFKDLGSSAEDYLLRIRRLEEEFGGSGRHLNQMIKRMKAVGEIGKNYEKVRDATYALERFVCSNLCRDREDPFYGEIIKDYFRYDVKREYNAYIHDNKLKDNAVSILEFLKRAVKVKRDEESERASKPKSKYKDKFKKKKKPLKDDKKDSKNRVQNANYQFFRSPVAESSTETSSDSDASWTDDSEDSDEGGNCYLQTRNEVCDFCEGLHNLFKCLKFFYELTYKDRRKWVEQGNRCTLCLKSGHDKEQCRTKRVCRFCKGPHNSCIHVEKKKATVKPSKSSKEAKKVKTTAAAAVVPEAPKTKVDTNAKKEFSGLVCDSSESDEGLIHSARREKGKNPVSLTTFVARLRNPTSGNIVKVNALADGGADHTVMSARVARKLGLWVTGAGDDYYVKGHGGRRGCYTAQKFQVELLGSEGETLRKIKVSSYEDPCGDLQIEKWNKLKQNWEHLKDLPLPEPVGDCVVDLILGSAALDLMEAKEPVRFGPPGGPVAKKTALGWIVGGRTQPTQSGSDADVLAEGRVNFSMRGRSDFETLKIQHDFETAQLNEYYRNKEDQLKHDLKLLWGTKECCRENLRNHISPPVENANDSKARDRFEQSLRLDEFGRPEVSLMWRDKSRPANNQALAFKIFLSMEKRMRNRPGLWEEFEKSVLDWVEKDYARLLDFSCRFEGFFIPTFMVIREDKSTTKYRLIMNGKFEFRTKSINNYLLSGPNVMNRLDEVLIRFRYHKYVLTCDVSNMFLRVRVPERDRKFLRFFFRTGTGDLKVVEMCSHAFGLTQSPFVVINVVKNHATKEADNFPLAARAVLEDSIVDDILTGCKTFDCLKNLKKEIGEMYQKINMETHKWATNSPSLRRAIPPKDSAAAVTIGSETEALFCADDGGVPSIKCLGILWHPETDMLQFFSDAEKTEKAWTMRKISSRTSKMFDPLGLMTPLMLEGKLLLQSLWKLKSGWDEEVPTEISVQYNRWLRKIHSSHLSHIARRVKASFKCKEERLLIFTDASSQAQAAVAYLWCCGRDQQKGSLWAAKQKISSLNRAESISRLELEGALMGVELAAQVCKAMKWDMREVKYFTDSTTVLWWLRTHRELDVFVGNRVCRILDKSRAEQWFHVSTSENPADIPTRGMSGKRLASCSLWWQGPSFLEQPYVNWPAQPEVVETRESYEGYRKEEKRRVENWLLVGLRASPRLEERTGWLLSFWYKLVMEFSNLNRGYAVACLVLKALGKFRRPPFSVNPSQVTLWMQNNLIKYAQHESLSQLLEKLQSAKTPDKKYSNLRPYLDDNSLIRVGGRLRDADRMPFSVRSPLLLDGDHDYSRRLFEHIHANVLRHCGGKDTLVAEARWQVWVIGGNQLAKKVTRSCVRCRRALKTKPMRVAEAPLHFTRLPLAEGCAFQEIGIDMAGPFYAKHGRSRATAKRFVLLFVCCWTRAISLEMMDGASTESCVMAFLRHCNLFGLPKYVNSDRGSNLVGLDRHLQEQWHVLVSEFEKQKSDWPLVRWHFNPPYSPRFSGHVETMVKLMKNSLRKILGQPQYLFRDEQLATLLKVTQGFANQRPLTTPSSDPHDPPPLTPSDFLLTGNRVLGSLPELKQSSYDLKVRKESLGEATKEMWQALCKEYLVTLQEYPKMRGNRSLNAGDIVLMLDKTLPTGRYCLGRVKEVKKGPDGQGRVFEVEHQGKILTRSGMTLAPLEVL